MLDFASKRKEAELRSGIVRNNSFWDKVIFRKIQVCLKASESKFAIAVFHMKGYNLVWLLSLIKDYLATQNKNQNCLFISNFIFLVPFVLIVSANCIREVTLKQSGASLLLLWKQTLSF